MNPLDCQQKIDMDLMSENQFGSLGDNENPNMFKIWNMIMVSNIPNQEIDSPLLIWRENEGPIMNKDMIFTYCILSINQWYR